MSDIDGIKYLGDAISDFRKEKKEEKAADEFADFFKKTDEGQTQMGALGAEGVRSGALNASNVYNTFSNMSLDRLYPMMMKDAMTSGDPQRIAVANAATATLEHYREGMLEMEERVKYKYDLKKMYAKSALSGDGGGGGSGGGGGKGGKITYEKVAAGEGLPLWNALTNDVKKVKIAVPSSISNAEDQIFELEVGGKDDPMKQFNDFYQKLAPKGGNLSAVKEHVKLSAETALMETAMNVLKDTNPAYRNEAAKPYLEQDAKIMVGNYLYGGKTALVAFDKNGNVSSRKIDLGQMPDFISSELASPETKYPGFESAIAEVENNFGKKLSLKQKKEIRENPKKISEYLKESEVFQFSKVVNENFLGSSQEQKDKVIEEFRKNGEKAYESRAYKDLLIREKEFNRNPTGLNKRF